MDQYGYPKDRIAIEKGVYFGSSVHEKAADIVVWDTVAIGVKRPTGSGELNTVASKIVRYKQHFAQFVCVLFDIEDPVHFREWLKGVEQNHPEVIVIAK